MSGKLFVAYLTSGLGNRLRPLAAAIAYCRLTGRELRVYWDSITPNGCLTPLERLYENEFSAITLDEIEALAGRSVGLFTEKGAGHGVQREAERFGRGQLLTLARHSTPQHSQALQIDDANDVVIVYDNDYLRCVPRDDSIAALRTLRPREDIRAKVQGLVDDHGLTLRTKGVHARGTDFGLKDALEMYTTVIRERVGAERFFLSTEDEQLEHGLRELFPRQLLSRNDRLHLQLNEGKAVWGDPDSYTVSADHGVDALIDIYLLSSLDLVVYHPGSTFAEISRHLHGVLQAPGTALARARAEFVDRARVLAPRGDAVVALDIVNGETGPRSPETLPPGYLYWETLGYRIPFLERSAASAEAPPASTWDAAAFSALARRSFDDFPHAEFGARCPHPEAFSQLATMRGYIAGRKLLIVGSRDCWLELFCAIAGAAEVTTVAPHEIRWAGTPDCKTRLRALRWDDYLGELERHQGRYDLVLCYGSIAQAGLGRDGAPISPLADLFTFMLMAQAKKPSGLCAIAVPAGPDLTLFDSQRVYGETRMRALEQISGLKYVGIVFPDTAQLAADPVASLRAGWTLPSLAALPLGSYRRPILCFGAPDFSVQRYAQGA